MNRRKRFTPAQRIGHQGEFALQERLTEFGWVPSKVHPDIGEDFIVGIMTNEGVPVGIDFYIQNKSTSVIDKKIRRGNYIRCEIDPQDIEYWDTKAIPVYIFIWDINNRVGYWIDSKEAKKELANRRGNWHTQRTVTIRIPVKNTTADKDLRRLQTQVGMHYLPLLVRDQGFNFKTNITFPDTPKGNATQSSFVRHLKFGDSIKIDSEFVAVTLPTWWKDIFDIKDNIPASLTMSSRSSGKMFPVKIELESHGVTEAPIQKVEFKVTKGGVEEITLSNEHERSLFHFTLILRHTGSCSLTLDIMDTGRVISLRETRDALLFMKALSEGGHCQIIPLLENIEEMTLHGEIKECPNIDFREPDPLQLTEDLIYIQKKTGYKFPLPLDVTDPYQINEVAEILRNGRVQYEEESYTIDIHLFPDYVSKTLEDFVRFHKGKETCTFSFIKSENIFELGGLRLDLGSLHRKIVGNIQLDNITVIEQLLSKNELSQDINKPFTVKVNFVNAQITDEYEKWLLS